MIPIKKGEEPERLALLHQREIDENLTPEQAYKKLRRRLKSQVRHSLVVEQGGLCAYCMCRIPGEGLPEGISPIVIEHFIPRNPEIGCNEGLGLDYNNLLAVCHGNRAPKGCRFYDDLTCDAHRGNTNFRKVNPCKPETLKSIYYELDGRISATDPDVRYDLTVTLNLNCPSSPLVKEREAMLNQLITYLGMVPEDELMDQCRLYLDHFLSETYPKTPYVGILIWYLKSMLGEE